MNLLDGPGVVVVTPDPIPQSAVCSSREDNDAAKGHRANRRRLSRTRLCTYKASRFIIQQVLPYVSRDHATYCRVFHFTDVIRARTRNAHASRKPANMLSLRK